MTYWEFPEQHRAAGHPVLRRGRARAGLARPARRACCRSTSPARSPAPTTRWRSTRRWPPRSSCCSPDRSCSCSSAGPSPSTACPRSGTSSATSPRASPSPAVYAVVFAALAMLVASLAGRRAVAAALIVALFLITTPDLRGADGDRLQRLRDGRAHRIDSELSQLAGLVSPMTLVNGRGPVVVRRPMDSVGPYGPLYGLVALGRRRGVRPAAAASIPEGGPMSTVRRQLSSSRA